ncbi:MAG TPA: aminodeoxychorismate/anthranilate synthase component II, partial [Holophaga sp.]|nr:aminodeoxychorismate/anthranilate synthase component II [Holophaga sp.]
LHERIEVHRNDALTPAGVLARNPDYLVLSPGPGTPSQAGNLLDIARQCGPRIPTLGVCLGHQALGQAFGGRIVHAPALVHGKTSPVYHSGHPLFEGLPSPFEGGRYHSLVVESESLPQDLLPVAHAADGELMAMVHAVHPIVGLQFHPESVLTPCGVQVLRNFLRLHRRKEVAA